MKYNFLVCPACHGTGKENFAHIGMKVYACWVCKGVPIRIVREKPDELDSQTTRGN